VPFRLITIQDLSICRTGEPLGYGGNEFGAKKKRQVRLGAFKLMTITPRQKEAREALGGLYSNPLGD